jgi:uncharacterized protein (TIGR03546 family)
MITRQIGKILRGKATPLQIMMAAILGSMLGFAPGFMQAPGLIVALTLLLIILNANLGIAAIIGLLAKLVSLALLPVSFAAGRMLLDGPTQGLFKWMINAPVLALFGFEYYATSGGMLVGLIFGILAGLIIIKLLSAYRRKMSTLEQNSEAFQKWTSKGWVKLLTFALIGGRKGKATYADLLEKRVGNPVRVLGVVFALLVVAMLYIAQAYLSGPILTMALHDGLERANGATVDLGNAAINLKEGKMVIANLAMADPNALDTDLLRAVKIEGDISGTDLLRKRARFDRIVVRDATSGDKRKTPGHLVGPPPRPSPPIETNPGEKTLDDYIAQAKLWKERLAQAREWMEKIYGQHEDGDQAESRETLKQRIERQIRESGYARVKASHLIEGAPTLVITDLVADGVKAANLEGEVFDIRGENLSTHPRLLKDAPRISVKSRSKNITLVARLREAASEGDGNRLRFTYLNLPVDMISKSFASGGAGAPPISGGTMDVDLRGNWSAKGVGNLNLPLNVTLHNTTITLPQAGSQKVSEMKLAMGLRGPMDDPRITIDQNMLAEALKSAGATALADHVRGEADKALDKAKDKATDKIGEKLNDALGDKAKGALGGLLPGSKSK